MSMNYLTEKVYHLIDSSIEDILSEHDTRTYLHGYYAAKKDELKTYRKLIADGKLSWKDSPYVDEEDMTLDPNFPALQALRDEMEDEVLRQLFGDTRPDGVLTGFLYDEVQDYDWCDAASSLAEEFDRD